MAINRDFNYRHTEPSLFGYVRLHIQVKRASIDKALVPVTNKAFEDVLARIRKAMNFGSKLRAHTPNEELWCSEFIGNHDDEVWPPLRIRNLW